jgi:hypothetical protein
LLLLLLKYRELYRLGASEERPGNVEHASDMLDELVVLTLLLVQGNEEKESGLRENAALLSGGRLNAEMEEFLRDRKLFELSSLVERLLLEDGVEVVLDGTDLMVTSGMKAKSTLSLVTLVEGRLSADFTGRMDNVDGFLSSDNIVSRSIGFD